MRTLAKDVITAYSNAVTAYYDLCVYIRDEQLTPKQVTETLRQVGYPASRISEVKKVSFSTPQIFAEYRAKTVGFKLALQAARADKPQKQETEEIATKEFFVADLSSLILKYCKDGKIPRWFPLTVEDSAFTVKLTVTKTKK